MPVATDMLEDMNRLAQVNVLPLNRFEADILLDGLTQEKLVTTAELPDADEPDPWKQKDLEQRLQRIAGLTLRLQRLFSE